MPYCPRCGVEVEDRLEKCPLCDTAIPGEVRDPQKTEGIYPADSVKARKMHRSLTVRQKRSLFFSLAVMACLLPLLLTPLLDYTRNGLISWSYYVMISLPALFGITLVGALSFRRPGLLVNASGLIILCWFMLFRKQFPGDFLLSVDFHIILAGAISADIFVFYLGKAKRKWQNAVGLSFLIISLFLIALDFSLSGMLRWSPIAVSALIPAAAFIFLTGIVRRRGLNVISIFFFLLSLMLVALDFTTDFSGWSLITFVIFCFLAFAALMMHAILFRDTDWKKVLHIV
jgi:hypothetical protein